MHQLDFEGMRTDVLNTKFDNIIHECSKQQTPEYLESLPSIKGSRKDRCPALDDIKSEELEYKESYVVE